MADTYITKSGNYFDKNGVKHNVVDAVTSAYKSIDSDHVYVHQGRLYESYVIMTIAASANYNIIISTANDDGYNHYRPSNIVSSKDNVTLEFFEDPTWSGGSEIDAVQHNRESTREAGTKIHAGATVTETGDKLAQIFMPGEQGTGQVRTGSAFGPAMNEWVLKKNEDYLIRVTNDSEQEQKVQINFFWYEEELGVSD